MSMKDVLATFGGQQTGDAPFSGGRKVPRSKGTSLNDVPKKQQRAGGEATGDTDAEVMNLVAQVHLKVIERILASKNENGGLSLPDQEKAEAIKR